VYIVSQLEACEHQTPGTFIFTVHAMDICNAYTQSKLVNNRLILYRQVICLC